MSIKGRPRRTDEQYFEDKKKDLLSKILIIGECWVWQRQVRKNFPHGVTSFRFNGRETKHQAHRVAYILWKGKIPESLFVLHQCDNPRCINPDHLHLGTQKDNIREMRERGRAKDETRGSKGEKHHKSKLKDEDILKIRKLRSEGYTGTKLAQMFGVTNPMIYYICNNKNWNHIKGD